MLSRRNPEASRFSCTRQFLCAAGVAVLIVARSRRAACTLSQTQTSIISRAGHTFHTEAAREPGFDVITSERDTSSNPLPFNTTVVGPIPLPRAGTQSWQEVTLDQNFGAHDLDYNNCVTYCARVLEQGGYDIDPSHTSESIASQLLNTIFPERDG
jgi:hypothetical protein